mgnify:CR=1 FL=1
MESKQSKSAPKSAEALSPKKAAAPQKVQAKPSIELAKLEEVVMEVARDEAARGRGFVRNVCRRILSDAQKVAQ